MRDLSQADVPIRISPIDPTAYTLAQARAAEALIASRGDLRGPFIPLLQAPELLDRVQKLGAYIRYESELSSRLREFCTLCTARIWNQAYEWQSHAPLALQAGVSPATIDAMAEGDFPQSAPHDEQVLWHFCTELHRDHKVSDATFERAIDSLGPAQIIEAVVLCGYYSTLAMVMNVAGYAVPAKPFATPQSDRAET